MKPRIISILLGLLLIWGCGSEGNQGPTAKAAPKPGKQGNVVKVKDKSSSALKGLDEHKSLLIEVTPPRKPGEMAMTPNQQHTEGPPQDPSKVAMTPPLKPGQSSMTVQEFKEIQDRRKKFDPNTAEVVPPGKAGGKGVTVAEFERKRAAQVREKVNVDELLAVPGKPGEKGMTVSEVNAIRKANPPVPSNEIPPPPMGGGTSNIGTGKKPNSP
jgi:hypothetical protein